MTNKEALVRLDELVWEQLIIDSLEGVVRTNEERLGAIKSSESILLHLIENRK
jgi:hypothetical protein